MAGYDFASIESKWQQYWADNQTFRQPNPGEAGFKARPKMYILDMFPYPSGAGLHVGHPEGYTATDIVARFGRMKGYNVLHPMGYDSFGLPAEQYAVEHGVHPRETTAKNIANIERQIKMFGFSYDWSRRVATTDVEYYRWTQWIFLQLYNSWYDPEANAARPISELVDKLLRGQLMVDINGDLKAVQAARKIPEISMMSPTFGEFKFSELEPDQQRRLIDEYRLAYMAEVPVNWCPKLGTVLANEEVTNEGKSDRGNYPVYRRAMKQWMLRITAYADRLLADIDNVDWPEPIKIMQRNWIGKSVGAEVDFPLEEDRGTAFQAVPNDELKRVASLPVSDYPGLWAKSFSPCDPFPKDQPNNPERSRSWRNLPHIRVPGATYFVTFRVEDKPLSEDERSAVLNAILFWQDKRCVIYGAVVMDTHAHLLIRPLEGFTLSDILHSIKRFAGREINLMRQCGGHVWQDESFDHIVRDGVSFNKFLYYICQNPTTRKSTSQPVLTQRFDQYKWLFVNEKEVSTEVGVPFGHSLQSCATSYDWFTDRQETGGFPPTPENDVIRVYTTRPDTLFGATYMVLAPEHELVSKITTPDQKPAVAEYVKTAANKSELERTADAKEKTGVFTGAYAVNPVTRQPIPIWVADYVMMGYGTGAIMAVPAHDTRDFEFAQKFDLPIVQVVQPPAGIDWKGFTDDGVAVNSGKYDGVATQEFKKKITADLAAAGLGKEATNYKLRDWLFSRQRYWGEPFPIVHCEKCGTVALNEKDLPLTLPEMADFKPAASDDPDALPKPPLGKATEWVNTTCPNCGGPATRELNTMPQWAGSCWYYLRYLDPKNERVFCNPKIEEYWMQSSGKPLLAPSSSEIGKQQSAVEGIDLYVGGAEHAVLHLLYSRFWHKVLFDLGYVSTAEPFGKLFNQGMIRSFAYRDKRGVCLAYEDVDTTGDKPRHKTTGEELIESIEKMSKSLKNVVNPDEVIAQYGADTFRLYEMFMGPLESSKPWNTRDVPGVHRFLQRVWRAIVGDEDHAGMVGPDAGDAELERALHKLIKKAGEDITAMKFNTAIAAMMEFVNQAYKIGHLGQSQAERLTLVLAPFAPHIAEELWGRLGHAQSLAHEAWPAYDPAMTVESTIQLPVQVNGKLRAVISAGKDDDQESLIAAALADPKVVAAIADKTIVKKIVVPGKMINLVIK